MTLSDRSTNDATECAACEAQATAERAGQPLCDVCAAKSDARAAGAAAYAITVYRGAKAPKPIAQDALTWPELADEIEALCKEPAPTKEAMHAIGPYRLRPGTARADRNVEAITLAALDVDGIAPAELDAAIAELEAMGVPYLVHGSPSDPLPDGRRKVRVYVPLAEPVAPADAWALRLGLAIAIGVPVDAQTKDASRLMFAGVLEGTPDREIWRSDDGEPLDATELIELARSLPAIERAAPSKATPTNDNAEPLAPATGRAARVAELLRPLFEQRGERHALARAIGGYLGRYPLGAWADAEISQVVRALPSTDHAARVRDALDAASRARRGAAAPGWEVLSAALGDGAAELEAAARSECWARAYAPGGWVARMTERHAAARAAAAANDTDPDRDAWHAPEASDDGANGSDRVRIDVKQSAQHETNAETLEALADVPNLYQRNFGLVRVIQESSDDYTGSVISKLPRSVLSSPV